MEREGTRNRVWRTQTAQLPACFRQDRREVPGKRQYEWNPDESRGSRPSKSGVQTNGESQGWPLDPWLSSKKEEKRNRFSAWPMMSSRWVVPPNCGPWPRGSSPAMSHATASNPIISQAARACSMDAPRNPYADGTSQPRWQNASDRLVAGLLVRVSQRGLRVHLVAGQALRGGL